DLAAGAGLVAAAVFGDDDQAGPHRVLVGSDRHHRAFADPANLPGDLLDLGREDVAAGDGDHLLGPAAHHQPAVDEVAEITGGEPGLAVDGWLSQITRHPRRAA